MLGPVVKAETKPVQQTYRRQPSNKTPLVSNKIANEFVELYKKAVTTDSLNQVSASAAKARAALAKQTAKTPKTSARPTTQKTVQKTTDVQKKISTPLNGGSTRPLFMGKATLVK